MAQASEELLIKIDIVDSDSANRINEISEELNRLKATQKDYEQAVKEGKQLTTEQGKEYVAVKARIADLNKEVNAHVKALQKEQQEQKKNVDSLNSMRAQLKDLIKAYDNMSKAERENAEIGGKQVAMINQLTDQIKELEEGTQRYQRNVGNYANSITKALASQVPVIGKVSGAMDMLKTSTGWIGIVIQGAVMLFSALSMAFKRTEGNADKLTGGLAKMKGLFVMVQQALEPLVKGLVDGFVVVLDKALQAVGWLGEKLQQFLRFVGADEWANKLESFAEKTKETAEATSELAVAEEQLARKQREARKTMLEYQRQAEELRQTRDDATKSAEEQEEANRKLLALLQEQKRVEGGIQQEAIRVAKMRIQLNGETTENLDALTDAETEYADVIERITGQSSEAIKWQNDRLAVLKEEILVIDELIKKTLDVNSVGHYRAQKPKFDIDEDDEEIIDEAKRLQELNNILLQYEQLGFDERLKLQQENLDIEHARRVASGEDAVVTEAWYQAEQTRIVKENAEARKQYALDVAQSSMAGASSMISSLKELAEVSGASAKYQKALALAEVALNTGQAISAGIASAMATPFPANIGAILTTISAVISGIAQAKSAIKSANIPTAKFAQGGLVTGEGTGTSDSIPAMLSNGESVMTARATSTYSPILSALNTSVGGAPIGASTNTRAMQQLVQQFANAVAEQPIYTSVVDINQGQERVAKIVDKY
jgi:predicted  nucleic acid-binding Zn-ribbon protein